MAGHSHWANIQHKKGIADAKRGKAWSKLARLIMVAARTGGGDPIMNLKLRYCIDKARAISMPKDNIERAVKKGTGDLAGEQMEELTYEGYGPGSVAVLVEVMTDNRNRTNGEVRKIFDKGGGKMGSSGNVAFLFDRKGVLTVDGKAADEDTLMGLALDAGADDLRRDGPVFEITTSPTSFAAVQDALQAAKLTILDASLAQVPKATREVDEETGKKIARLMDALDDHDDVQSVYTDADLTEAMLAG